MPYDFKGDPGTTAATPISRPISNSTSYYRGNDASSASINGNQTPLSPSPTKEMSRVTRFRLIRIKYEIAVKLEQIKSSDHLRIPVKYIKKTFV